jgi:hypothetical protein
MALFDDVVHLIKHDQFDEVNDLVPALEAHIGSVPPELYADFVMTLLDQAGSRSHRGAPAAQRILSTLPDEMAKPALPRLDKRFLDSYGNKPFVHNFVKAFGKYADAKQRPMLKDLLKLSDQQFCEKYFPEDF